MSAVYRCPSLHTWTGEGPCPVCGEPATEVARFGETPRDAGAAGASTGSWRARTPGTGDGAGGPPGWPDISGYVIREEIGGGGMGVVYRATQVALGRDVAVKVVRAGELAAPADRERFVREAEVVATLSHPNIVRVYDVGVAGGRLYYTMELVPGRTLAAVADGPMDPDDAARLVGTVARAAGYAHAHGVVHRDLKPANVLVTPDGVPMLVDFGVAKRLAADDGLTDTGKPVGTPAYMAPEQAAGRKDIRPAADVYALGVILYRLLTGRVPFDGDNLYDVLHQIITADPVSPAWYRPDIPPDLEAICLKCLAKDPARRYASAEALADDLDRFLARKPTAARPLGRFGRAALWCRRRPALAASVALAVAAVAAAGAGAWWYYDAHLRVHTAYYVNYVKRWGVAEGVGPLTEAEAGQRPLSYRFHTRGGRVERVDIVDRDGRPTSDNRLLFLDPLDGKSTGRWERELRNAHTLGDDSAVGELSVVLAHHLETNKRVCSITFDRDAGGRVTDEVGRDAGGRVVYRFHHLSATTATFTNAAGYPITRGSNGAAYIEFVYDDDGWAREFWYRDANRQPTTDSEGAYGWRVENDGRGQVTKVTLLDAAGNPFGTRDGYAAVAFVNNAAGLRTEHTLLGADGRPVAHRETGVARTRYEYDEHGRVTEERYFDALGNPATDKDGQAAIRTSYAGRDDILTEFLGADGRPHPVYRTAATRTATRPDGTRLTAYRFRDAHGRPAYAASQVAGMDLTHDQLGNLTEQVFVDADGRPTFNSLGFAREVMTYNADGRLTEHRFFDPDGRPARTDDWVARAAYEYDPAGNRTRERFYGPDGALTLCKDWYAEAVYEYGPSGRMTACEYRDRDGKPTLCRDRYARAEYEYGPGGWVTRWRFLGPDGKPAWHRKGYQVLAKEYDARGLEVANRCYGPEGRPVNSWVGPHETRYVRDARGHVARESYFNPAGKPYTTSAGYTAVEYARDAYGRTTAETYFGADGARVAHSDGHWERRLAYAPTGEVRETSYHDAAGNLAGRTTEVAVEQTDRDWNGATKTETYLDARRRRVAGPDGVASTATYYDPRHRIARVEFRDATGKLTPGGAKHAYRTMDRDDRGRTARVRWFNADGTPHDAGGGRYGFGQVYDDRGLVVGRPNLGPAGDPLGAAAPEGFASEESVYDERGLKTEGRCVNAAGRVVAPTGYIPRIVYANDARGNETSRSFLGADGRPFRHDDGHARVTWKYVAQDVSQEHAFYDTEGRLVVLPEAGYARLVREINPWGYFERVEYHGADDQLIAGPGGYAVWEADYTPAHEYTDVRYFDAAGSRLAAEVRVIAVGPGMPADRLGIKVGDVMTHYAGKPLTSHEMFAPLHSAEYPPGARRVLRVVRGGKPLEVDIPPAGRLGIVMKTFMLPKPRPAREVAPPPRRMLSLFDLGI